MGLSNIQNIEHGSNTRRVDEFYAKASVFTTNKFHVGLYGEYLESAITEMAQKAESTGDAAIEESKYARKEGFDFWHSTFVDEVTSSRTKMVDLKWACENVDIPTVTTLLNDKSVIMDTTKGIDYTVAVGHSGPGKIKLTIVEDKHMNMWQFFNALHNQFYETGMLRAKSSFQKLGIFCAITQGLNVDATHLAEVPVMLYEFNSAVITNVTTPKFSRSSTEKATFTVELSVPNLFQGTYKSDFKGLANLTTNVAANNALQSFGYKDMNYKKLDSQSFFESNISS